MRSMPRWLGFALCAGIAAASSAAVAGPAYVPSTVNLRAAPGTTSEVVTKIPGGSLIDANACSEGWCAVTWQGKSGFAKQTALDMSGRVPQQRAAQRRTYPAQTAVQGEVYEDEGPADYVAEAPPVYYAPRPYYYGYGPYYRSWGWRHRW
ncbi:MAG: ligand-binding protein [Hyphomicrobiales bacterium]|nr:ligand-binding protein [Hyphomicrobiales bacterium]